MHRVTIGLAAAGLTLFGLAQGGGAVAGADQPVGPSGGLHGPVPFRVTTILAGDSLHHSFLPQGRSTPMTEPLRDPDDITQLGDDLFVGFQNGVGPQGQASTSGNRDSTVVELTRTGRPVGQWDVVGKTDGVTAYPAIGAVIATVNEDANSALYVIHPSPAAAVTRYAYNEPLPHAGGTDAISIDGGRILISASAPGTTGEPAPQPTYPAVYSVTLDTSTRIATVSPLFYDEAKATVANVNQADSGTLVNLALTDPDSNEVVPAYGPRFAGDFMLTSQGDQRQIFVSNPGRADQHLSVLTLSQSVDDTA
jgi:hypothetical protein